MKEYINPSIEVVTIETTHLMTPSIFTNEQSDAAQLSQEALFSDWEEEEELLIN
jgi:hypothetical protein